MRSMHIRLLTLGAGLLAVLALQATQVAAQGTGSRPPTVADAPPPPPQPPNFPTPPPTPAPVPAPTRQATRPVIRSTTITTPAPTPTPTPTPTPSPTPTPTPSATPAPGPGVTPPPGDGDGSAGGSIPWLTILAGASGVTNLGLLVALRLLRRRTADAF